MASLCACVCVPVAACLQAILSKHLARLNNSDITQMVGESLTSITLELYSAVLEKLPPTPSRFHYVFNLRDLSRVYEGLLRSCADGIQQPGEFLRLWRNEVRLSLPKLECGATAMRRQHGLCGFSGKHCIWYLYLYPGTNDSFQAARTACISSACVQKYASACRLIHHANRSRTADVQVLRVFHDRLVCAEDKALLQAKVAELVQRRLVAARM